MSEPRPPANNEKHFRPNPRQRWLSHFLAMGLSNKECAEITGYAEGSISAIRNSPLMHAYVEGLKTQLEDKLISEHFIPLSERFNREADNSFDRLVQLRDGAESESVSLKAAESILDRAPIAPKTKREELQEKVISITFGKDETDDFKKVLAENGTPFEPALITDGEYTVLPNEETQEEQNSDKPLIPEGITTLDELLMQIEKEEDIKLE